MGKILLASDCNIGLTCAQAYARLGRISNWGRVRRQAIAIAATTAKLNLRELRPEIEMHPLPGYAAAPRVED